MVDEARGGRLRLAGRFLDLFALCGLALAQPTLDILGKSSGLFLTYDASPAQVVALVGLILFVPPAVLFGIECLVAIVVPERYRNVLHAVVCGLVVGVIAAEIVRHGIGASGPAAIAAGAAAAIGAALVLSRWQPARTFVRVLVVAPLIFAISFLGFSPASAVILDRDDDGGAAATVTDPHRVVLVVLDELPVESLLDGQGGIDRELYPNFAAFADASTWYRNSRTVAGFTQGAVPAILTGDYPSDEDAVPTAASYPDSLFTLLAGTYDVNAHEVVTRLCPSDICNRDSSGGIGDLAGKTADLWWTFASKPSDTVQFDDADAWKNVESNFASFMTSLQPTARGERPKLDFLHFELPHYPWRFLPSLQRFPYVTGDPPGESYLDLWPSRPGLEAAQQRHLLQVGAVDTLLGQVVKRLKRIDAWDDSLVIVTADHGISFELGEPARNPSAENMPGVAWTPLLVKYPNESRGAVDDRRAESIDVVPTIVDVLGARHTARFDGVSLRDAPQADGTGRMYPWIWRPTAKDLQPPPGRSYVGVDGPAGFAQVRRAQAAPSGAEAGLRVYQRGPFGPLVGNAVSEYRQSPRADVTAMVQHLDRFATVDPEAKDVDWAWNTGAVSGVDIETPIVIAANGRIVAATAAQLPTNGIAPFTFLVPPSLLRPGRNAITAYVVRGTIADPSLEPIALSGT